jgi:dipeptidyl aminopeptidase/acylaminoacyl peptidase
VQGLRFSPDGAYLAAWSDRTYGEGEGYVVDAKTGAVVHSFDHVNKLAFSRDSKTLAVAVQGANTSEVQLYNIKEDRVTTTLQSAYAGFTSAAFSPDARFVAAIDTNRTTIVWERGSGRVVDVFQAGTSVGDQTLFDVVFSPDSRLLAATDGVNIVLWDLTAHTQFVRPINDAASLNNVTFSPDGQYLLEAQVNGPVVVRYASPPGWVSQACSIANRNLTADEWTHLIGDEPYHATCQGLATPASSSARSGSPTTSAASSSPSPTDRALPPPSDTTYVARLPGPGCGDTGALWVTYTAAETGSVSNARPRG